uniref:Uncharacterized protein n=1 Tax=Solanum tuberosum TaxID=4113 RepID=M1DGH5_SOLTU
MSFNSHLDMRHKDKYSWDDRVHRYLISNFLGFHVSFFITHCEPEDGNCDSSHSHGSTAAKELTPIVQKHFCFSSSQASALLIKPPMITERKKPLTSISTDDDPGLNDIIEEARVEYLES